jgi:hypothetical protein
LAARKNWEASQRKIAGLVAKSLSIKWDSNRSFKTIAQALVDVFPEFLRLPVLST